MHNYPSNPGEIVESFFRNRGLIINLVHREVVGRYKNSMLGLFWSLVTPALMLAVYTFVFSIVFRARWNPENETKIEFSMILFAGLIVFNVFSECINRAPTLILSNINYVKKVVFPLEILPWVVMGSALFHFAISLGVWLVAYLLLIGMPNWSVLLIPFVMAPLIFFVMGLSWAAASLGVYLRDVSQISGIVVQALMFLTPIFYPVSAVPEGIQILMFINPLTSAVEMLRDVIYWGRLPNFLIWSAGTAASLIIAILGFSWFQKTRKGFADVL